MIPDQSELPFFPFPLSFCFSICLSVGLCVFDSLSFPPIPFGILFLWVFFFFFFLVLFVYISLLLFCLKNGVVDRAMACVCQAHLSSRIHL